MTDNYVVLFERGAYKGIVGPYTADGAKSTIIGNEKADSSEQRTSLRHPVMTRHT